MFSGDKDKPSPEEIKQQTELVEKEPPKPKIMENMDLYEEALKRKGIEFNKPARVMLPSGGETAKVIVLKTETGFDLYSNYLLPLTITDLAFDEKCKTVGDKR